MGAGAALPTFIGNSNPATNSFMSGGAVINGPAGKFYVADNNIPGTIYKWSTGVGATAPGPNPDNSLQLPAGTRGLCAAIDVANDIAYWGASGTPGVIYKILLNSGTTAAPTIIGSLPLSGGEGTPDSIALDLTNG